MVIEAGLEITLKAGGSFIKLDPSGITLVGPMVKINAGGAPGNGSGITIKPPLQPGMADKDKAGNLLDENLANSLSSLKQKPKRMLNFSS
jgi:type VI secretion system secreted protein VgrG